MAENAIDVKATVDAEPTTPDTSTGEIDLLGDDNSMSDDFVRGLTGAPDEPEEEESKGTDKPDKPEEDPKEPASTEEKPSESTDSEDEKSNRALERKQQLNLEIRDKVAERNALREEIAELSRQKYELQSAQDIPTVEALMEQINPNTGDYYTRAEAENLRLSQRLDAMEKQKEFDGYVERVTDNRIQLSNEANQVVKDFPIFDPESKEYDAELTQMADELMKAQLIIDKKTGQVIGSRVSPYQLYSVIAKAKTSGEASGKTSGRKSALDMMNNADVASSAKAPSSDEENDPFLQGLLGE